MPPGGLTCTKEPTVSHGAAEDVPSLLGRVCDLIAARIDARRIADAKRRQADMFAMRPSDSVPILFGRAVPEAAGLPGAL